MKKLVLPLIAILMAALMFGCSGGNGTPGADNSGKKSSSPDEFKQHLIVLDAPEGAENAKYFSYTEKDGEEEIFIAEVDYTYAGSKCVLKCANVKNKNISGIEESGEPQVFDLSVGLFSSQLRIYKAEKTSLALWCLGNYSYSLSSDNAESFEIAAIDAAQSNEPASTEGADTSEAVVSDPFEEASATSSAADGEN